MSDDTNNLRSVRIDPTERGGWSSERPRKDGEEPRPRTVSTRKLEPADRLSYDKGSLVLIAGPDQRARAGVLEKATEARRFDVAEFSVELAEKVAELDDAVAGAGRVMAGATDKHLGLGTSVAVSLAGLDASERAQFVAAAKDRGRPVHLILCDAGSEAAGEHRDALNDLRARAEAADLGDEGISTVCVLGARSRSELRGIAFRERR